MGSKRIIAKEILPFILEGRIENQFYIEPFCGGCNLIDKVEGNRIANDKNEYLISMFKSLQKGWEPPNEISEGLYNNIKNNKFRYKKELVGFVGFCCSFGGKWFNGYARGKDRNNLDRNYALESKISLLKSLPKLKDIIFYNTDYRKVTIYEDSIVYCDPPYRNTECYKDRFSHIHFYNWCRKLSKLNCKVFVSEYWMPEDFKCIWEKEVNSSLDLNTSSKKEIERLYTI
jgi:DNA adenine methylase